MKFRLKFLWRRLFHRNKVVGWQPGERQQMEDRLRRRQKQGRQAERSL